MTIEKKNEVAPKTQLTSDDLQPVLDYIQDQFEGNLVDLVDYFNHSLKIINKHIDREQEPLLVANVIDNMFAMQDAFIECVRKK